jgi:hypothetical protein
MKLSFDDKDSFMEAAGSLCFNNPPSDPNPNTTTHQQVGTQEGSEDIGIDNPSNDPNTLQQMGRISEEILVIART